VRVSVHDKQRSGSRTGRRAGRALLVIVGLMLLAMPVPADQVDDEIAPPESDLQVAFESIREAWRMEDQQALADIVHPDGLRVNNPAAANRYTSYSPSQAFYYFKNLFQNHDTDDFTFRRVQETDDSPRIHALVQWTRHRTESDHEEILRLMIVLTRNGEGWGLAEINTIR
jgi:hypothetical protein